jgi:hypothetical protein
MNLEMSASDIVEVLEKISRMAENIDWTKRYLVERLDKLDVRLACLEESLGRAIAPPRPRPVSKGK